MEGGYLMATGHLMATMAASASRANGRHRRRIFSPLRQSLISWANGRHEWRRDSIIAGDGVGAFSHHAGEIDAMNGVFFRPYGAMNGAFFALLPNIHGVSFALLPIIDGACYRTGEMGAIHGVFFALSPIINGASLCPHLPP